MERDGDISSSPAYAGRYQVRVGRRSAKVHDDNRLGRRWAIQDYS
jgi:hypothetical protein